MNTQYSFKHFLDFFCPFKGILGDTPIFNINFLLLLEVGQKGIVPVLEKHWLPTTSLLWVRWFLFCFGKDSSSIERVKLQLIMGCINQFIHVMHAYGSKLSQPWDRGIGTTPFKWVQGVRNQKQVEWVRLQVQVLCFPKLGWVE